MASGTDTVKEKLSPFVTHGDCWIRFMVFKFDLLIPLALAVSINENDIKNMIESRQPNTK
jgi:hypothetical protein